MRSMRAGLSSGGTNCGGFAGAMPMSPWNRSKRIWRGCARAMDNFNATISRTRALGAPGPSRTAESSTAAPAQGHSPMRQLLLDFTQAPAPTFENFVPGGNAELLQALRAAARGESPERVVYVWGESGAGKSHLARAFAEATAGRQGMRVIDDVERFDADAQAAL